MTTRVVNTHEVKSRLSELIREAEDGVGVIVARYGQPVARCIPRRLVHPLGKLDIPDGLAGVLESGGFVSLPISAEHADFATTLPAHHRGPFDRMLIAQAQLEALAPVTADEALAAYDIEFFDARS